MSIASPQARPCRRPFSIRHNEAAEQHSAGRHLENQRVEPFDQKQLEVGSHAVDFHGNAGHDAPWIGDHGGESGRRLLECTLFGWAEPAHPAIGLVGEKLPAGTLLGRSDDIRERLR